METSKEVSWFKMNPGQEDMPMICRERHEKRAVKMVVQDLPRPD